MYQKTIKIVYIKQIDPNEEHEPEKIICLQS